LQSHDGARALGLCAKVGVVQESADIFGRLTIEHIKPNQRVSPVQQRPVEVIPIMGEESHLFQSMQEGDDFRILDPWLRQIFHKKPKADAPFSQSFALILPNIFVQ